MHRIRLLPLRWLWILGLAAGLWADEESRYEFRAIHDPNGIGKFYMGREIARVMGHEAADWLERPEREREEAPSRAVEALELRDGMVVADIGAGTGYYALRIAPRVAPRGRVLAVDIQQEMLELLSARAKQNGVPNVVPILGEVADPRLPADSVDLVLMVDVYHELEYPYEMMQALKRALKPDGRLVLIEFRAEDPRVPIKEVHKLSEAQAKKEMEAAGFLWEKTDARLPWQHILFFRIAP